MQSSKNIIPKYWSGDRLLSMLDINGKKPEIYIADGVCTAGKTYYFKTHLIENWRKYKKQFFIIKRRKKDLYNVTDAFFEDLRDRYPGDAMTEKPVAGGDMRRLFYNGEQCGYAIPLSDPTSIKNLSGMLTVLSEGFFDEFQALSENYLDDEIGKMMAVRTCIARGHGEQTRRVPVYMAANHISILNPYYYELGIDKRLRSNTHFLRGDGWVLEIVDNETAKAAYQSNAFNNAFKSNKYYNHASDNYYINDNNALVGKIPLKDTEYILTIRYEGEYYNARRSDDYMYISRGYDETFKNQICFRANDIIDDGALYIGHNSSVLFYLRRVFNRGKMRFDCLQSKHMIFDLLRYGR